MLKDLKSGKCKGLDLFNPRKQKLSISYAKLDNIFQSVVFQSVVFQSVVM